VNRVARGVSEGIFHEARVKSAGVAAHPAHHQDELAAQNARRPLGHQHHAIVDPFDRGRMGVALDGALQECVVAFAQRFQTHLRARTELRAHRIWEQKAYLHDNSRSPNIFSSKCMWGGAILLLFTDSSCVEVSTLCIVYLPDFLYFLFFFVFYVSG